MSLNAKQQEAVTECLQALWRQVTKPAERTEAMRAEFDSNVGQLLGKLLRKVHQGAVMESIALVGEAEKNAEGMGYEMSLMRAALKRASELRNLGWNECHTDAPGCDPDSTGTTQAQYKAAADEIEAQIKTALG